MQMDFTICEAKTNVLITMLLICAFVLAYAKSRFFVVENFKFEDSCWNFCKYSVKLCILSQNITQKSISQEQPVITQTRPCNIVQFFTAVKMAIFS